MNEKPKYRWALLDKRGKNRGTVEAFTGSEACKEFRRRRGEKLIPQGWKVVKREQVLTMGAVLVVGSDAQVRAERIVAGEIAAHGLKASSLGSTVLEEAHASLKAANEQVERLTQERDEALRELARMAQFHADAVDDLGHAETKLVDIAALIHAWNLMKSTDRHNIRDAMLAVLEREA